MFKSLTVSLFSIQIKATIHKKCKTVQTSDHNEWLVQHGPVSNVTQCFSRAVLKWRQGRCGGNRDLCTSQMQMKHGYMWRSAVKLKSKGRFDIYKCIFWGSCTLEAGPNKTKRSRHKIFLHWASHLRWNGRYVSVNQQKACLDHSHTHWTTDSQSQLAKKESLCVLFSKIE